MLSTRPRLSCLRQRLSIGLCISVLLATACGPENSEADTEADNEADTDTGTEPSLAEIRVLRVDLRPEFLGGEVPPLAGVHLIAVDIEIENRSEVDLDRGLLQFSLEGRSGVVYRAHPLTEALDGSCRTGTSQAPTTLGTCALVFALDDGDLPRTLRYFIAQDEHVEAEVSPCADRDNVVCNYNCVDIATNSQHCGDCFDAVAYGNCIDGQASCGPNTLCDGECVALSADPENCGSCGARVEADRECINGTPQCATPLSECDGECVDLDLDPENCGECGVVAEGDGVLCRDGAPACEIENRVICGDECANLTGSLDHCGACGAACPILPNPEYNRICLSHDNACALHFLTPGMETCETYCEQLELTCTSAGVGTCDCGDLPPEGTCRCRCATPLQGS